jgi:bifunctional non-homologous end joining protein LigD
LSHACPDLSIDRRSGGDWLHEIKHDGFRIMARRDAAGVRLLTRNGYDFAGRFPLAAAAVAALSARSCLIDGEAIVTDQKGLAVFDLIRGHQPSAAAVLCAFGLLELDGEDLRREPIETRKSTLRSLLRGKHAGIVFNAQNFRGWRNRLPAGLCARLRGYRVEAPGLTLPRRPGGLLGQGQEPGCAGGHARGRRGVELKPNRKTGANQ